VSGARLQLGAAIEISAAATAKRARPKATLEIAEGRTRRGAVLLAVRAMGQAPSTRHASAIAARATRKAARALWWCNAMAMACNGHGVASELVRPVLAPTARDPALQERALERSDVPAAPLDGRVDESRRDRVDLGLDRRSAGKLQVRACPPVAFWDRHLPVLMSVRDGYAYLAIERDSLRVVAGREPEYEEVTPVADTVGEMLALVAAGDPRRALRI